MSSSSRSGVFGHFFSLFVVGGFEAKEENVRFFQLRVLVVVHFCTCYYTVLFSSSFLSLSLSRSAFSL